MSTHNNISSTQNLEVSHAAHVLNSTQREQIARRAIRGDAPIAHIAQEYGTSRKFIYQQKGKGLEGISHAFQMQNSDLADEDKILFHIPVTKKWLMQAVLGLLFTCRASYQGVGEFCRDLFDHHICKGTVHNIVYSHLTKAKQINSQQDLSGVTVGLHDEIYQAGDPVLVGCCAKSTYCYLLDLETSCDANSWGVHLLDLREKQGLVPDFTVIDGGPSARKGQKDAWPEIPANGDVFHALKPFLEAVKYLENRAMSSLKAVDDLTYKLDNLRGKWKEEENKRNLQHKLVKANEVAKQAVTLFDELAILYRWLRNDILSLVGPSRADRQELLKFIVQELSSRESLCQHKIEPIRKYLENHSDNLLQFVPTMESYFYEIAQEFEVSLDDVLAIYQLKGLPSTSQKRWEQYTTLRARLGKRFYWIESMVNEILDSTVRANSLVENLNSRLRTYFTLRRELGNEYLSFLQFFLNHRRFMRSGHPDRVGKSPAELLTGQRHKHWLEMLGFELFKQAA